MKNNAITIESEHENPTEFTKLITHYVSKNALKKKSAESKTEHLKHKIDLDTKRLLLYLFTASRGGPNRIRILLLLAEKPRNTHQLAKELGMHYRAIKHHLGILKKNNMITQTGDKYGAIFFLSEFLEFNIESFNEIVSNYIKP